MLRRDDYRARRRYARGRRRRASPDVALTVSDEVAALLVLESARLVAGGMSLGGLPVWRAYDWQRRTCPSAAIDSREAG